MTKIKICGLSREQDIDYVNEALPDYIGFVFAESRRRISPEQAQALRKRLEPDILAAGVFVDAPIEAVLEICRRGIIDAIQLHGSESRSYVGELRTRTGLPVIKAISMTSESGTEKIPEADYYLFDQGAGGTGKTFDWSLIPRTEKPYFLAGGLSPDNLREAIRRVKPYAVDLSSGVETDGAKDRTKIIQAVRSVRNE